MDNGEHAMKSEWQYHLKWINENVIGPPLTTDKYTQKELERMNMVGVYEKLGDT
jgi:hypothetical protein